MDGKRIRGSIDIHHAVIAFPNPVHTPVNLIERILIVRIITQKLDVLLALFQVFHTAFSLTQFPLVSGKPPFAQAASIDPLLILVYAFLSEAIRFPISSFKRLASFGLTHSMPVGSMRLTGLSRQYAYGDHCQYLFASGSRVRNLPNAAS